MDKGSKIYVAGHNGLVGSAIMRNLQSKGYKNVVTQTRQELDLLNQHAVVNFFTQERPEYVFLAAAKVGGIAANNNYPANFIYENLLIQCNIVHSSHVANVKQLLFLGSSCIYPKFSQQPMAESELLTGVLEKTNEPYAIAKIAGIKLCESYNRQYGRDYRSVMPTNLYGPFDNFHSKNSHVIPALIRRFHEAKLNNDKRVVAWGSGNPMREFLYVDDMATASIYVMKLDRSTYEENTESMLSHINIGTGVDCTIRYLVETVAKVVGFTGDIQFDSSQPDGVPQKLLDVTKLNLLGWQYSVGLEEGLSKTYQWFLKNQNKFRC